jgi:hypothetical protein
MPKNSKKSSKKVFPSQKRKSSAVTTGSVHPWRLCPYGEHWVKTHPLHIPPSAKSPEGHVTTRHEHCARNPSGKDQLYPDEILEIAKQHFATLAEKPCVLPLNFGARGSLYDSLIGGWVQYWNDVLKPDTPLDSNMVKALIASESSFDPTKLANPKNSNSARGLMQITNDTRKILGDEKGELKDQFITVTKKDLNDPGVNICSGIRWLFQKRKLLSSRLKRQATWLETIWEYKGIDSTKTSKDEAENIQEIFESYYRRYQKCGKP